jgi:hypothetical protein
MTIEFREHRTLRHPFQLQVLRSGTLVGLRRNAAAGVYQYLRGEPRRVVQLAEQVKASASISPS